MHSDAHNRLDSRLRGNDGTGLAEVALSTGGEVGAIMREMGGCYGYSVLALGLPRYDFNIRLCGISYARNKERAIAALPETRSSPPV